MIGTRKDRFETLVWSGIPLTGFGLSPQELGRLAKQMVETHDCAEADRLQKEIERGFYGT